MKQIFMYITYMLDMNITYIERFGTLITTG
jgi:hypothetical protein